MTAGTKAILLLSVFGLVVLVACYGDGPSSASSDQITDQISIRSKDPLLTSASEISSPRQRMTPNRPPVAATTTRPVVSMPTDFSTGSTKPVRSVEVVKEVPSGPPTFTMGAARSPGITVPSASMPTSASTRPHADRTRASSPPATVFSESSVTKASRESSASKTSTSTEKMTVHVIKPGDTLGHIAQKYYGSARSWTRIADANPDVDVDSLRVGQELRVPAREISNSVRGTTTRPVPVPTGRTHTIDEGETLSSIAEDHLGDQSHWYRIYELNKQRIGASPDRLVVGMVIAVPE